MRLSAAALALTVVVTACAGETVSSIETEAIAPQEPAAVSEGEALYQAACAACHGSDLRGSDAGPSLLSDIYEPGHHPDFTFFRAVQEGAAQHHWSFGPMAPIEHLEEAEIASIVAFIREVQRVEGYEPYPPEDT